jgi:hypothetical protein
MAYPTKPLFLPCCTNTSRGRGKGAVQRAGADHQGPTPTAEKSQADHGAGSTIGFFSLDAVHYSNVLKDKTGNIL